MAQPPRPRQPELHWKIKTVFDGNREQLRTRPVTVNQPGPQSHLARLPLRIVQSQRNPRGVSQCRGSQLRRNCRRKRFSIDCIDSISVLPGATEAESR